MINSEEFYNQKDSAYLRVQYLNEKEGFRIIMRNEALLSKEVETEHGVMIGNIARGMLELAYSDPAYVHSLGKHCLSQDIMRASSDNLSEEHKKVWLSEPPSESIN